jgi:hypothetical protein
MKTTVVRIAFGVLAASTFSFQSHAAAETDACSLVTAGGAVGSG